jgi:hypothetical protein
MPGLPGGCEATIPGSGILGNVGPLAGPRRGVETTLICADALKRPALPESGCTSSVVFAPHTRFPLAHAGAGGARSRAISDRMSVDIGRDTRLRSFGTIGTLS